MFALFEWGTYYPQGGWRDFVAMFDSLAEAIAHRDRDVGAAKYRPDEHASIVDLDAGTVGGEWERDVGFLGQPVDRDRPLGGYVFPDGTVSANHEPTPDGTIKWGYTEWVPDE